MIPKSKEAYLQRQADIFLACNGRPQDYPPSRAASKGMALARRQAGSFIFQPKLSRKLAPCRHFEALNFEAPAALPEGSADGWVFSDPFEILAARETLAALHDLQVAAAMEKYFSDMSSAALASELRVTRRHARRLKQSAREIEYRMLLLHKRG